MSNNWDGNNYVLPMSSQFLVLICHFEVEKHQLYQITINSVTLVFVPAKLPLLRAVSPTEAIRGH